MNRRQAKRIAAGAIADLVERHAGQLVHGYGSADDRERMRASLAELAGEMRTRSGRTPLAAPDPNQVPLFDPAVVVRAPKED